MHRFFLTSLVFSTACAGTLGEVSHRRHHDVSIATYAAEVALTTCDVAGTVWMSHDGRYDRLSRPGYRLAEMNPLLGHEPSPTLLIGAAVGNAVLGYALLRSDAPEWFKTAVLGAVGAIELGMNVNNYAHVGVCGMGGRQAGFVGSDETVAR